MLLWRALMGLGSYRLRFGAKLASLALHVKEHLNVIAETLPHREVTLILRVDGLKEVVSHQSVGLRAYPSVKLPLSGLVFLFLIMGFHVRENFPRIIFESLTGCMMQGLKLGRVLVAI